MFGLLFLLILFFSLFFIGSVPQADKIAWGVNFSQKHSQSLGLDWKENYLALLDDLKVRNIKLAAHWDLIEPQENQFNFQDLDWQIEKAEEKGAKLVLAIGMKTPRWPECHVPEWAKSKSKQEQQEEILKMLENILLRYKDLTVIRKIKHMAAIVNQFRKPTEAMSKGKYDRIFGTSAAIPPVAKKNL